MQAATIVDQVIESVSLPHELDVIGGNAGAIPILLSLASESGFERCHDLAIALGEELCRTAVDQCSGWAWKPVAASGSGMGSVPHTGLSHGAAGMGLARLRVVRRNWATRLSGNCPWVGCIRRRALRSGTRRLPDLRRNLDRPGFARSWCHGAPGIALARLRAGMLDEEFKEIYNAWARIAITTTLGAIEENLVTVRSDASLCHGLAGLGEIVWHAGQIVDDPTYRDRALELGQALINRHSASEDWPSGVPSHGPNPSLMLGTAGIGSGCSAFTIRNEFLSVLLICPGDGKAGETGFRRSPSAIHRTGRIGGSRACGSLGDADRDDARAAGPRCRGCGSGNGRTSPVSPTRGHSDGGIKRNPDAPPGNDAVPFTR